jgi:large subunit ribosomal protein L4
LAQAIRVYEARSHPHLAKTKTRGEIRASKAKIYRQKGTGRARHGARSAPIFVGGGVTHGPKGIKRELTLPKKMRQKAFRSALTLKAKNGEIVVVEGISTLKKTKEAATLIDKIAGKEAQMKQNGRVTFVLSDKNSSAKLALRNLKNVDVVRLSDLNAYRVYFGGILVIDKEALEESREGSRGRTDSRESIKGIKGKSVKSVSKSV